jgi:sigma-B regulation protein RsbU (phosphoserine phosphatase)
LIVTYFLIGVLPLALVIALVVLIGYVVVMQSSSSLVGRQLDGYVEQSHAAALALGRDLSRAEAGQPGPAQLRQQLQERAEALAPMFPQVSLSVSRSEPPAQQITVTAPGGVEGNVERNRTERPNGPNAIDASSAGDLSKTPEWLSKRSEFHGLIVTRTAAGAREVRAHHFLRLNSPSTSVFQLSYPIGDELTRHLTHTTGLSVKPGRAFLPDLSRAPTGDRATDNRQIELAGRQASHTSLQLGGYPIIMPITDWETGERMESEALSVDPSFLRPGQIWGRIQRVKSGSFIGELFFTLITSLGVIFLLIALVAIGSAMLLTRSITGTVHNLYRGTQRIEAGDLEHEIPIRGRDQLSGLAVSFNQMTGSVRELLRVSAEKQRLDQEMLIAADVQARLFPRRVPRSEALDVAPGVCIPARLVSGDYYDFLEAGPGLLGIVVADVCGKGVSAALMMANLQANLRGQVLAYFDAYRDRMRLAAPAESTDHPRPVEYSTSQSRVRRIVERVNRQIVASMMDASYVTMFYGEFNERTSVMLYTNAGHNPPLLVRRHRDRKGAKPEVERLDRGGTVLGLFPDVEYEDVEVRLEGGDLLAAFSDGLVEAHNPQGKEFGEERLIPLLEQYVDLSAAQIESLVLQAVRAWTAGAEQEDDLTLVVLKRR